MATLICVGATPTARADFKSELQQAVRPLQEGIPQLSVIRLQSLLSKNPADDQWQAIAERLSEALIAAGRPSEALVLLDDKRIAQTAAPKFWRAQALAALHRWNEALPMFQVAAEDNSHPFQSAAIFGMAETLRALGRRDEALARLVPLLHDKEWQTRAALRSAELFLDKSDPIAARKLLDAINEKTIAEGKERRFLRGRIEMVQNRPDRALPHFERLLKRPHFVAHSLIVATLFQVADAHLQLKTPETGDDFLEDFIDHHADDAALPEMFMKLDQLYRAERKPVRAELERWARESQQPRRGFAQWYLARIDLRAGRHDRALSLFAALRDSNPKIPELAAGLYEFARVEMDDHNFDEALAILEQARSWRPTAELSERINFLAAEASYAARKFEAATAGFEQLAEGRSPLAIPALYNASLGWLQLGDGRRFAAAYEQLQRDDGAKSSAVDLRLEEALLQAARGQKQAAQTLQKFISDFPQNPRVSEAWVALAELAFHSDPAHIDEARQFLTRAREGNPTAAADERAQYLTIWIEDAIGASNDQVIELSNRFLKQHPHSNFAADVRMKLAESYFARHDFANAQTQFELFAQEHSSSPLVEKALFFAAESAMASMAPHSLDRAIVLFDQVAQRQGALRWAARNEEAVIERRLDKPQQALLLYGEVLKNDAKPGDRREALCGKGDVFLDLGATDSHNYDRAIECYNQLIAESADSPSWRNQALFKKGVCLEKKADRDTALSTFYEVLDAPGSRPPSAEFFWFYKAGFNAAQLLETDSQWNSAARVYEKLVAAGGSRSDEAKARLNRLRLEHFLWEQ